MAETANESHERVFLVVVDKTEEMRLALRFACRRARNTDGRVALLYVIPPADFGHWMAVDDMIAEERRAEAEEKLQKLSEQVFEQTGKMPVVHIRQGDARDELLALIAEEPGISILVLAASRGPKGPGPLITALTGKLWAKLPIPLTIVPGEMSKERLESIT